MKSMDRTQAIDLNLLRPYSMKAKKSEMFLIILCMRLLDLLKNMI